MAKKIREIAHDLGLSETTIKLILNGNAEKYRISKKTQLRVNEYINEHGYQINQAARSLKLNKSETLGLIIPSLTNPYFSELAEYLGRECQKSGYQLITTSSLDEPEQEKKQTNALLSRGIDGLFIASTSEERQASICNEMNGKPSVFIDRDFGLSNNFVVCSDNLKGSLEMTLKLLDISTSDIFFLYADDYLPSIKQRLKGFTQAHKLRGRALHKDWGISGKGNTVIGGYSAMAKLYNNLNALPKILVFSSLPILEGALKWISETHNMIPKNIIFATFDDHPMLELLPNLLFSVNQNSEEMAKIASSFMQMQLLEKTNHSTLSEVVQPTLIKRNYTSQ